jgi:hypothetical protein
LANAELKVNATKSHLCCDEHEYLGYLINRKGATHNGESRSHHENRHTKNQKAIEKLHIGMVNYCRICSNKGHTYWHLYLPSPQQRLSEIGQQNVKMPLRI